MTHPPNKKSLASLAAGAGRSIDEMINSSPLRINIICKSSQFVNILAILAIIAIPCEGCILW